MALINPSNLYSEGQVNLDSTPYLRMQQQQQAKQQAREDALYKYFSELPNKINAAGMRVQDIDGAAGGFNKKLQDVRSFWNTNKQNIIRGGRAQQAYQQLIQDATQYADQSKKTAQFQLKFGQDYFKGKHKPRERDLEVIAAIDRPIDDDGHYKDKDIKMPYSYNDFSIAAPDFDANKQAAFDKELLGKTEPQILPNETPRFDPNTYEVIYNKKYRPEDVYAIAQKAAGDIKGNLSAMNFYEDALADKDQVKTASEALSKMAGVEVIAETPEQMAAGLKAAQLMNFSKEERKKDVAAVNEYKKKMADYNFEIWRKKNGITFGQRKQMAQQQHEYQKAMKFGYGNEWLENEWKNLTEKPVGTISYTKADGTKENVKLLGVTSQYKKAFESQGYEPDDVIMYPNGDVSGIIYERYTKEDKGKQEGQIKKSETGNKPIVQSVIPVRLNKEQAKIAYGKSITSGKDLTEELSPAEQKVIEEKEKTKSLAERMKAAKGIK